MTEYKLPELDQYLAIDCEFVGCRSGSTLAKVGIVDHQGSIVLESFVYVNPKNIIDHRTSSSGIRPGDLDGAPTFEEITRLIKDLIQGKILVGHTLFNDLSAIQHRHPYEPFRDTASYYPLRRRMGITREGEFPSLKKISKEILGLDIQVPGQPNDQSEGKVGHDPIEDARATMSIFMTVREEYEIALIKNQDCISGIPSAYEMCFW